MVTLAKQVKDLCDEIFKALKKEIEVIGRQKKHSFSWTIMIIIVKMAILSKAIYGFNANSIDVSKQFFT